MTSLASTGVGAYAHIRHTLVVVIIITIILKHRHLSHHPGIISKLFFFSDPSGPSTLVDLAVIFTGFLRLIK